ncbi:MAG: hypothetical protein PHH83_02210 [Patescibacteria group bacterium]|nr:hypothetical protein [Patescibacteria group bacterium]
MKNIVNNKIIIFLLVIVIIMGFVFYFLNKTERENSLKIKQKNEQDESMVIIKRKQEKIGLLQKEIESMFETREFSNFKNTLESYITLPINVGRVGNTNPFGAYQLEQ